MQNNNNEGTAYRNIIEQEPEYLTTEQLSKKLNVSAKVINKWVQARRLPVIKMGRMNRFPRNEINRRLLSGQLLFDRRA
jgi:excisionase family DNA binding protein